MRFDQVTWRVRNIAGDRLLQYPSLAWDRGPLTTEWVNAGRDIEWRRWMFGMRYKGLEQAMTSKGQ